MFPKPFDLFRVFSVEEVNSHLFFFLVIVDIGFLGLEFGGPGGHQGVAIAVAVVNVGVLAAFRVRVIFFAGVKIAFLA